MSSGGLRLGEKRAHHRRFGAAKIAGQSHQPIDAPAQRAGGFACFHFGAGTTVPHFLHVRRFSSLENFR